MGTRAADASKAYRPIRISMIKICMAISNFDVDGHVPPHQHPEVGHGQVNDRFAMQKTCHFVVSSYRTCPSHNANRTTGTAFIIPQTPP